MGRLASDNPRRRLVIAPNASLSPRRARWFFIATCAVSFTVAGAMSVLGLWLIWPFAGLEMGALGAALYRCLRDNGYREVVSVYADRIEIEAGLAAPERRWEFPRLLTQVRVSRGRYQHSPARLLVTRHGRGCELGRCLTEAERVAVARRLKSWVTATDLV